MLWAVNRTAASGPRLGRELAERVARRARPAAPRSPGARCQCSIISSSRGPPSAGRQRVGRGPGPSGVVAHAGARVVRGRARARSTGADAGAPPVRPPRPRCAGTANLAPPATTKRPGARRSRARADPLDLRGGALVERGGPADGPVAALEIGEQLGRRGAAAPDLGVEVGQLVERARGAVRHDEHADGLHGAPRSCGEVGRATSRARGRRCGPARRDRSRAAPRGRG